MLCCLRVVFYFFFQAEDGIRDLVRSRGLGDVYKRQALHTAQSESLAEWQAALDVLALAASRDTAAALSLIHI